MVSQSSFNINSIPTRLLLINQFRSVTVILGKAQITVLSTGTFIFICSLGERALCKIIRLKFDKNMVLLDKINLPVGIREGWGLARDWARPTIMYISDGSNTIFECDASQNFKIIKTHEIYEKDAQVDFLNELEYIDGFLFCNIWMSKKIIKIDLKSDKIVATFDYSHLIVAASGISQKMKRNSFSVDNCLNGIAFDPTSRKMFITGKQWPVIFDIKFDDPIFNK